MKDFSSLECPNQQQLFLIANLPQKYSCNPLMFHPGKGGPIAKDSRNGQLILSPAILSLGRRLCHAEEDLTLWWM